MGLAIGLATVRRLAETLLAVSTILPCTATCAQLSVTTSVGSRGTPASNATASPAQLAEARHASPEWQSISDHLPNPKTATAQQLEPAADVLRARKYPNEALEFYRYALNRGGKPILLLNKIGVTEMELQMNAPAQLEFRRVVKLDKKNAEGWNNLGSVEYLQRRFSGAVGDYKKAVSLNKNSATFHSNLANAYFQLEYFTRARKEFATALALDPHVFEYTGAGGVRMQMQSPQDRGRLCYEMARMYAIQGNEAATLHWLEAAKDAGVDLLAELRSDRAMVKYRKDPRVLMIVQNERSLKNRNAQSSSGEAIPSLPANGSPP